MKRKIRESSVLQSISNAERALLCVVSLGGLLVNKVALLFAVGIVYITTL